MAGALGAALGRTKDRLAAAGTLAVTASGVTLMGVGSAFWGLSSGLSSSASTAREALRKARGVAFERQLEPAAEEADRVVVADQRDHLEDLRLVEMRGERRPGRVADGAMVDQIVDQRRAAPARRPSSRRRRPGRAPWPRPARASKPTRSAKKAICTPHSYSQPSRAVVRSITISRWRRLSGPLSRRPPANILAKTRGLLAMVRNSTSGSTPGGMMRASSAAICGS